MGTAMFLAASNVVLAAQSDETFLKTAIGINLAEIEMGQLAQKTGSSSGVRDFGATLEKDHSASNADAMALAKTHNFAAPNAPSTDDQKAYQDLSGMTGAAFDKAFAEHMVEGHQKAIQLFTDESSSAKGDVKSFADKTLPTLKKHLATAQKLVSDLGGTAMNQNNGAMATQTPANTALVEPTKISANDLINTTVYDSNNRNIGEVHDVVLNKDGKIDAVVLDVGGFLGIGEKSVALAFEDLQFRRDNNNKLYVYAKYTQQQLEQAPKYDKKLYETQRDTMRLRSSTASP
jgi:predicted outer membrane protein/sporulation protein YlmC with PRC-barrel domain